jgi:hypothetical protein
MLQNGFLNQFFIGHKTMTFIQSIFQIGIVIRSREADCVHMVLDDGKWNDVSCDQLNQLTLCEAEHPCT